jgi:hypothetical protein
LTIEFLFSLPACHPDGLAFSFDEKSVVLPGETAEVASSFFCGGISSLWRVVGLTFR